MATAWAGWRRCFPRTRGDVPQYHYPNQPSPACRKPPTSRPNNAIKTFHITYLLFSRCETTIAARNNRQTAEPKTCTNSAHTRTGAHRPPRDSKTMSNNSEPSDGDNDTLPCSDSYDTRHDSSHPNAPKQDPPAQRPQGPTSHNAPTRPPHTSNAPRAASDPIHNPHTEVNPNTILRPATAARRRSAIPFELLGRPHLRRPPGWLTVSRFSNSRALPDGGAGSGIAAMPARPQESGLARAGRVPRRWRASRVPRR